MKYNSYLIADTLFNVFYSEYKFNNYDTIFSYNEKLYNPNIDKDCEPYKDKVHVNIDVAGIDKPDELITTKGYEGISGEKTNEGYVVYLKDAAGNIAHLIKTSFDWSNISILSSMQQKLPFEGSAGEVIFRTSLLFHEGIVVHASAIEYKGKGIVFPAPSGVGKSTHAGLWKLHRGAGILNGDRPAIRMSEGHPFVYGTPWSGRSREYLNQKAPLIAIVMLEQASTNSIRKLSTEEAVQMFIPRCYIPYYDIDLISMAVKNAGNLILKTPCFLLKCRPDIQAMELVEKLLET